ncbi:MAG: four helix bundle protein [Candidatus Goldbacteria bacterium]|nr:four helix bundle protein [Candidatus Goldiibacteriota bacterium]
MEQKTDLNYLTKKLGIEVIKFTSTLPHNLPSKIIANQIIKSSTSVGANYRSVYRARSKAEFIAKLGLVEEETDETLYWLEILQETGIVSETSIKEIYLIAKQILAMTIASLKTAKKNPKFRYK